MRCGGSVWFRQRGIGRTGDDVKKNAAAAAGRLVLTVSIDDGSVSATESEYYVMPSPTHNYHDGLCRLLCIRVSSASKQDDGAVLPRVVNTIL